MRVSKHIIVFLTITATQIIWAQASIVNSDGTGDYLTIQAAIDAGAHGDTITVMPGTYTENLDFKGKALSVFSSDTNNQQAHVIDAGYNGSAILCVSGESLATVIEGFTLKSGSADNGGAIFCLDSSLTVTNCTFTDNSAINGGAVMLDSNSSPLFLNCTFNSNDATYGGAVDSKQSHPTFSNCSFISNNSTNAAGAIRFSENSTSVLSNCTFSLNSSFYGGAIECRSSDISLQDCVFNQNSSSSGGAIYFWRSSCGLTNCDFVDNSASGYGGGIFVIEGDASLTGCSFNSNSADSQGGGIFCVLKTELDLRNTIFIENNSTLGGAISAINESNALIANTSFIKNSAQTCGAGIKSQLNSDLVFVNCLFNGNLSSSDSAVSIDQGRFEMINCTLHANIADNHACIALSNCTEQPQIIHSIFWQNDDNNIVSSNCDPNVRYCCIQGGYNGDGNFDKDPNFLNPLGLDGISGNFDDNLQLSLDSPCIDAGNNCLVPFDFPDLDGDNNIQNEPLPFDILSNLRQVDVPQVADTGYSYFPCAAVVDIGAYEYQVPPPIAGDIDSDGDVDFADFSILANNWLMGI